MTSRLDFLKGATALASGVVVNKYIRPINGRDVAVHVWRDESPGHAIAPLNILVLRGTVGRRCRKHARKRIDSCSSPSAKQKSSQPGKPVRNKNHRRTMLRAISSIAVVRSALTGAAGVSATLAGAILGIATSANAQTKSNRDELLAADRAMAKAAEKMDLVSAITNMLADSATLIALGETFHGVPAARAALSRNPDNAISKFSWTPIYGEVAADGKTGFTLGFSTWKKPDNTEALGKYVAYWTKQSTGWRVLVYKRTGRAAGDVSMAEEPPTKMVASASQKFKSADSIRFAKQLDSTERAFSDEANVIGLGTAFTKYSSPDGHHTGAATDAGFRHGPADIGAGISSGGETPLGLLTWKPDIVYVASTGDVGITFGFISIAASNGNAARRTSYLTIWKRASVNDPWRLAVE